MFRAKSHRKQNEHRGNDSKSRIYQRICELVYFACFEIDISSGSHAKCGYLGISHVACTGVDYVVDIEREPLPFPDNSV